MACTCGGTTEKGFIPDFGTFATWVLTWLPGEPSTTKGVVDRLKTGGGVSVEGKDVMMVEAERCQSCGKLELFARQSPPWGGSPA